MPSLSALASRVVKRLPAKIRKLLPRKFRYHHNNPQQFVQRGDDVIYIGMWRTETMESWSRAIARRSGIGTSPNEGTLWIVEADPKNCEILAYEAQRRELANVKVINAALWSETKDLELSRQRVTDRNFVLASNIIGKADLYSPDNMRETIIVKAYTLDTIIKDHGIPLNKVRHVHFTIGGSEVEALSGADSLLQQGGTTIFIKSITRHRDSGARLVHDILGFLKDRGISYSVRRTEKDGQPKEILING